MSITNEDLHEFIYGIRIVPIRGKSGVVFAGFEGIVISPTHKGFDFIEISKMVKRNGRYFVESSISIPFEETLKHSLSSGEYKASFLYTKAKEFAKGSEKIAICEELVPHLRLLDANWKLFKNNKY